MSKAQRYDYSIHRLGAYRGARRAPDRGRPPGRGLSPRRTLAAWQVRRGGPGRSARGVLHLVSHAGPASGGPGRRGDRDSSYWRNELVTTVVKPVEVAGERGGERESVVESDPAAVALGHEAYTGPAQAVAEATGVLVDADLLLLSGAALSLGPAAGDASDLDAVLGRHGECADGALEHRDTPKSARSFSGPDSHRRHLVLVILRRHQTVLRGVRRHTARVPGTENLGVVQRRSG